MEFEYTGYQNVYLNEEEMAQFYSDKTLARPFKQNEYAIIRDINGEPVDYYIFKNGCFEKVNYTCLNSSTLGKIKPLNPEQFLAFSMLHDDNIKVKVLTGRYGSGKSLSALAYAIESLEKGKYDKIVYIRNNINVKDTNEIGHLPGTSDAKLLPYLMPLADHLGSQMLLEEYISQGKIEPIHLGYLRGRDLRHSIIFCSEAQNLSVDHVKLLLGRVGEGSVLILDGDFKAQVDRAIFERSSGLKKAIEKLSGNKNFGYVHLIKSERSEVAALADLLDD